LLFVTLVATLVAALVTLVGLLVRVLVSGVRCLVAAQARRRGARAVEGGGRERAHLSQR
jgi:hypothetical protein